MGFGPRTRKMFIPIPALPCSIGEDTKELCLHLSKLKVSIRDYIQVLIQLGDYNSHTCNHYILLTIFSLTWEV